METFTPIDSFSQLHSYSYSIIALQELNLNYFYNRVYWNCACLSIEATGITDEGEDRTKTSSTDYGEVAKAIYKMQKYGVNVLPPSVNSSNLDFTPQEETDSILFGIGGISKINNEIATQIINNRPYNSFEDFYNKNSYEGSLITNTKFVQLIKSGAFDEFSRNRIKIMKQYVVLSTPKKTELKMSNLSNAIRIGTTIPKKLIAPYNFKKYVCSKRFLYGTHPNFKSKKLYWLDEKAQKYFFKNCSSQLQEGADWYEENGMMLVVDKSLDKLLKPTMDALKEYINTPEFIDDYNKCTWREKYRGLIEVENINKWGFEACSYYPYGGHELENLDLNRYNISSFSNLPKDPVFIERNWGKRSWKQYELSAITGVVLDRNDSHHLVSILTPENEVVNIKFNGNAYAFYKQQLSEVNKDGSKTVMDKSWFERGSLIIVVGYRRGDDFVSKKYSQSIFQHLVQKIDIVHEDGSADIRGTRYGYEEEE